MERVIDMFSKKQIEFMHKIGISINSFDNLTDSDYEQIETKVSEHLQKKGFDKDYSPTKDGEMCESILDML